MAKQKPWSVSKERIADQNRPYPEIVDPDYNPKSGRHYRIRTAEGRKALGEINRVARLMYVPLDSSEAAESIRDHELAHAKWSPEEVPNVPFAKQFIQAVEDARINEGLRRIGMPFKSGHTAEQIKLSTVLSAESEDYGTVVLRATSAIGTDLEAWMRGFVRKKLPAPYNRLGTYWLDRISTSMERARKKGGKDTVPPFKTTLRLAREMSKVFDLIDEEIANMEEAAMGIPAPGKGGGEAMDMRGSAASSADAEGGEDGDGEGSSEGDGAESDPLDGAEETSRSKGGTKSKVRDAGRGSKGAIRTKKPTKRQREGELTQSPGLLGGLKPEDLAPPTEEVDEVTAQMIEEIAKAEADAERELAEYRKDVLGEDESEDDGESDVKEGARVVNVYRDLGNSGTMKVIEVPLTVPQPRVHGLNAKRPACAEEGTMIRRPDRLLIDGAIFARRKKRNGATVLIDQSGSMTFTMQMCEELVAACGVDTVVATYSGRDSDGELRIVANGAFRAGRSDLRRYGLGNIVDWPALLWLSKQRGPRIWVCDGHVTGVGDSSYSDVTEACFRIAEENAIGRIPTVYEAIEHFQSSGRTNRVI